MLGSSLEQGSVTEEVLHSRHNPDGLVNLTLFLNPGRLVARQNDEDPLFSLAYAAQPAMGVVRELSRGLPRP